MTTTHISTLFQQFANIRVGVIGDFAVDLYFGLQTETGERSLETGLDVFWGSHPKASLGAAGNVVQNLVALGVTTVQVIGCVGNDLFGREMQYLFQSLGVDTTHLHTAPASWDTCLYTKPSRNGQETNRIDFGTGNTVSDAFFSTLLTGLEQSLTELDVLIINQQFASPLLTEKRVTLLNELIARYPNVRFIADMRTVGTQVCGATLKVNTAELARFLAIDHPDDPNLDWCIRHGNAFRAHSNGPLLITRGQSGILYIDSTEIQSVDGLSLTGPLDTVGAGDTVVAAWAACRGADATPAQALTLANLAAAVTVQKCNQTGTASLSEILALHHSHSSDD
ncbi:bifunctional heptose 7-phosphate kinase/heptose 1-phosphate adenyltransferase [Spirosoma agri]|uniref:Carbohydrate kinase n=1 Tax=Spirosoma agri TaxID=1987381 RepID=A0A6M0IJ29_9BACT|nr:PfkB family carbohydrate kinase [Spirosoma agri]NEU67832.1 carbohydrate kinase [Spirosoma agri]